jgi:hypothetical protein
VSLQCIGKSHFSARHSRLRRSPLPFFPVKIASAQFGDTDLAGWEQVPNRLAAHANSRIIPSSVNVRTRFVTDFSRRKSGLFDGSVFRRIVWEKQIVKSQKAILTNKIN